MKSWGVLGSEDWQQSGRRKKGGGREDQWGGGIGKGCYPLITTQSWGHGSEGVEKGKEAGKS